MMSRKSQSQKKRHTKPCKFFQTNRCPHAADACDFAHVMADLFGGLPTDKTSPICRYYYAGHCANGVMCRYRHESQVPPTKPFDVRTVTDSVADWAAVASSEATYPDSPPRYGTSHSYIHSWPPAVYCPVNSPIPSQSPEFMTFAPSARSRDSMQSLDTTSTTNSNSSLESDDVIVVTNDPQYHEHSHSDQSQICVADDSPLIHVPPFHTPFLYPINTGSQTPTNMYPEYMYGVGTGVKGTSSVKSPSPVSKSSLKQKALKFKTKPCKFFPTEKGCPNGSTCTFLHDELASGRASPAFAKVSFPVKEDSTRKNFIPIPWRVIGGGVLLSATKKDEDEHATFDAAHADCTLPSRPNLGMLPLKIVSRQRSNSIPPTPSITQVKVEHLFSAESPGVL